MHPSPGEKNNLFPVALREDARHKAQDTAEKKQGPQNSDLMFYSWSPGTGQVMTLGQVRAKDVTETDVGQAQAETLSSLSAHSELCVKERGVVKLCETPATYLACVPASFMST